MNGGSQALATSLLLARMGAGAQSAPEQILLERLQMAGCGAAGAAPELMTAVYVGLKLHWWTVLHGPARERAMACLEAVATTFVGTGSGQTLHIHGPIGSDMMQQRFAALRLGEFVAGALEQPDRSTAWFILIDTPGDPRDTLRWVGAEVAATLRANGRPGRVLPPNIFVLAAAGAAPAQPERCWLPLAAATWGEGGASMGALRTPPVGYQRQLLHSQLDRVAYRRRLRASDAWVRADAAAWSRGPERRLVARWLAASVDERGGGLWVRSDPVANARQAVGVLHSLYGRSADVV